ncbi:MAG: polysaccharide biosynthesis tyrosine autokinase [Gammaproteobacteria bacterium]|nr:polysaccharide biosynthesis tyrosine autokinase [Gammaproteobacteria bacterium]
MPLTSPQSGQDDDDSLNIGEYFATLLSHKWLIISVTLLGLLAGFFYNFISKPVYRADALLQVEEEASGLVSFEALGALGESSSSVDAEIEILRSRMVLGNVVDRLRLQVVAAPRYAPVIGEAVARRFRESGVAKPWFGQDQLAWGGEKIEVERLDVPDYLLGQALRLTSGETGGYTIEDPEGTWQFNGRVGERLQEMLPGGEELALFVSYLKARPGTEFELLRNSRIDTISALVGKLSIREKGRGSGIVQIALEGHDRVGQKAILDQLMYVYVRQNVERRSAEAESTLQFLETQLPALKEQLDAAEAAYNSYRLEEGSVDLTSETQSVLASVVRVDKELVDLQQEREELRQRFKPEHPRLKALDGKMARLQRKRAELDKNVAELPGTQQKILRLKRDVEVNTRLYTELLNTAQQLRVAKAGTVGNVRIVDEAAASTEPVAPKTPMILAGSLVLGFIFSVVLIWLLRSLRVTVETPEAIERNLGLPVLATVPHSKLEDRLAKATKTGKSKMGLLALEDGEDDSIESLRSLRTTLRFTMAESDRGGVLITGPSQGIGKSFVSKNLAVLLAQAGETVALVDGDMRRGHLHREFGLEKNLGLSEFLSQDLGFDAIVKPTIVEGLDIITCGERPPNSSELLMNSRLELLVQALLNTYNQVVIDAPPILAISDAATLARYVGTTIMVARAGQHPLAELEQALKRMSMSGIKTSGFVLNDLDTTRMRYRYGYSGYHYQYKYK